MSKIGIVPSNQANKQDLITLALQSLRTQSPQKMSKQYWVQKMIQKMEHLWIKMKIKNKRTLSKSWKRKQVLIQTSKLKIRQKMTASRNLWIYSVKWWRVNSTNSIKIRVYLMMRRRTWCRRRLLMIKIFKAWFYNFTRSTKSKTESNQIQMYKRSSKDKR